jgi:hypothetical protein
MAEEKKEEKKADAPKKSFISKTATVFGIVAVCGILIVAIIIIGGTFAQMMIIEFNSAIGGITNSLIQTGQIVGRGISGAIRSIFGGVSNVIFTILLYVVLLAWAVVIARDMIQDFTKKK